MKRRVAVLLLVLPSVSIAFAQTQPHQKQSKPLKVEQVFVRGNRRITEAEIRSLIGTHKRGPYDPKQLDLDVRNLYDTGHFTDVKVSSEDGSRGGKVVWFELTERPVISEIVYEDVDPALAAEISQELQTKNIDVIEGADYDPVKVRRATVAIRNFRIKLGEPGATIVPVVEAVGPTTVRIIFRFGN